MDLDEPYVPALVLDRNADAPLYSQISEPLERLIATGALAPGQLIEDEVSMAQRLEVSRPTARRALQDLVARGLLTRRRGAGTRVTPTHVRRSLGLTSLNDDLLRAGLTPSTEVLSYSVALADTEDAELLQVEEKTEIVRIERLRYIDDQPLALLTNLLCSDVAPSLTQLADHGLYACLGERGIRLVSATQVIGARTVTAEEAETMAMKPGDPILTMVRTAYDSTGRVIEYGSHIYNASLYSFTYTLTDSQTS